jgi:translation elongation factor EF-G
MISPGPFQEVEVECPAEIVGTVIGKLSAVGSLVRESRADGNRCFVVADVPEDAVRGFARWLTELDPVQVLCNVGSPQKGEDV